MENLTIYTASAGSGKTYQLALNYIWTLFRSPDAYQRILAVTFTNKASSEMKKRILDKLFQLARGDKRADDYAHFLLDKKVAASPQELKFRSGQLLKNILHHYSGFYIQTIDKFFQWIIRGFTREIGLQNGYFLEFNTKLVLSEAVDRLIYSMDEDEDLKNWLIRFAEDRLTQGKSWDINNDIFSLGDEVFKENYQSLQVESPDPEKMKEKFTLLRDQLNKGVSEFEKSVRDKGILAMKTIESAGLTLDDFKGKDRGVISIFKRAVSKPVRTLDPRDINRKGIDDFNVWVKKGDRNEGVIRSLYDSLLNDLLKDLVLMWDTHSSLYFTELVMRNNLYTFAILNDISDKIYEITREKNLFLISDSSMFLKNIIAGNDAPFIYEKAGNYFHHFMLDEFQDTSRFQWENFLPLIQNSLAAGNSNLIVGDVKQAIYRWRNSDWKILAGEIRESIPQERIEFKRLNTNHRSSKNIVAFNNSVFSFAKAEFRRLLNELIDRDKLPLSPDYWISLASGIYGEPQQKLAFFLQNSEGYVRSIFQVSSGKEENLEGIREWLPATIMDLQNRNFRAKDITILVRTAREGNQVVRILTEAGAKIDQKYNFNLISNDSLMIGNNTSVKFLLALLRFFRQKDDRLNASFIKHEYLAYLSGNNDIKVDWHSVFFGGKGLEENFRINSSFNEFLGKVEEFRKLPLYELSEALILFFGLNKLKEDVAYIQAFQDIILDFTRKENGEISSFLRLWDTDIKSYKLSVSESQDAIRIMTIHKAKGLEFNTVIIPFCDWNIYPESRGMKRTILWPDTIKTGLNVFPHVPVYYGSELKTSLFMEDYYEETCRTFIDNINLMYVAFTRAVHELHTFSVVSEDASRIKNVGDFFHAILLDHSIMNQNQDFPMADLKPGYNHENRSFSYGIASSYKPEEDASESIETEVLESYPVTNNAIKLHLNHKNIYLSDLREDEKGYTGYGTQMHEIFSGIRTTGTIEESLRKAWLKGLINSNEKDALHKEIYEKLSKYPFSDWFSENWLSRTEVEIIDDKGNIIRPDRIMTSSGAAVVLDYKFGYIKRPAYDDQMRNYYSTLKNTGMNEIKLYLWYYNLNEIVEVKT